MEFRRNSLTVRRVYAYRHSGSCCIKQAITLQPLVNQVSELPVEKELEYYFVPAEYMEQFNSYYKPGKP